MGIFEQFDLMARGGSLALFALWSWLLVRDHSDVLAARIGVLMNLGIVCYLLVTAGLNVGFNPLLTIGAGAAPGLFWLFSKAWFNDEKRLSWIAVLLVVLSIANVLVMRVTYSSGNSINHVTGIVFRITMLGFATAGLWEAWRGRSEDLVEGRRRLRLRIVGAVGCYVILIAITETAVFKAAAPRWIISMVGSSVVVIMFLFCATMLGMRQSDLFGAAVAPKPIATKSAATDPLATKLRAYIDHEMAWRDEGLTISALAAQLGEQEYRLRRVINGQLGYRNFSAFLNGYRLAEVTAALSDPEQREVPIITIALDAGFGSLGPFNRAFREAEGMTPSEYRADNAG